MKTILVPIDFSSIAENALIYAIELNKKLNDEILIFHAYEVPLPITDIPVITPDAEFQKAAVKSLKQLYDKHKANNPSMQFKIQTSMGSPSQEIVSMEIKSNCSMVVMGSYGDDVMHHLVAGKHVAPVLSKSNCPVVVVPRNLTFKHLNKIVYAINFGADDLENSMNVAALALKFNAEMIILHVITNEKGHRQQHVEVEKFKESVVEQSGYQKISYKLLEHNNVVEGINFYLDEINADMLIVNMRRRKLIDRIFDRSLTRKITYHASLPLMVMHTSLD